MFDYILYIEINIFAALILFIIMDKSSGALMPPDERLFRFELISIILVLIFDGLAWMVDGSAYLDLIKTFNFLYWVFVFFPCYVGLLYCIYQVYGRLRKNLIFLLGAPVLVGFALIISNIWSDHIYYFDSGNHYVRGEFIYLADLLPLFHLSGAVYITFKKWVTSKSYEKHKYGMLMIFMLIPLVGTFFQVAIYGLQTIWITLSLSMVMCYVYVQNNNLTMDSLTGLNNRRRFDKYSSLMFKNHENYENIYLIILDINKFKHINDTYGHAEGDLALIRAANILKESVSEGRGFLARIGGDEFAIILHDTDEIQIKDLIDRIHDISKKCNTNSHSKYQLSFSIGYSFADTQNNINFNQLFAKADFEMYKNKKSLALK